MSRAPVITHMTRSSLLLVTLLLAGTAWLHAEPLSFQEISLMIRTGETPQSIIKEASSRKLLQALTPDQEAKLRASGAPPALLNALHAPELLASADVTALYQAHQQAVSAAVVRNRFIADIEAAKTAPDRAVRASEAFSLSQLEQAKARAQSEHKPLGFVMIWGTMLDAPASTRQKGSNPALLHFCEAFKNSVVFVFVRHETDLSKVPKAVSQGYTSPEEGGYAPNMAVVDASAQELIVEIPGGNLDAPNRDAVFTKDAAKIQAWLAAHPTAMATSAPGPQ
jgi:hypothetical protein